MSFVPLAELFKESIIPTSSSPKFKRPRAPFYIEHWCPWIRAHTQSISYLYSPFQVETPSPKSSRGVISAVKKELGKAGFYHNPIVKALWGRAWKAIAKMSGNPELPSKEIEGKNEEEIIESEFLIVAEEGTAVRFANKLAEMSRERVLLLTHIPLPMLEEEAREKLASDVNIIDARYLGKFEDGIYAINREKKKIYKLAASKIAFFLSIRDLFPIFENNDIPGIVSANLAIQMILRYSSLKGVRKISVIVNSEEGVKEAQKLSSKKEVNILATGSFKNSELAKKIGAIPVEEIEAVGYKRLEKIKILSPKKEEIETDLLVSAIKGMPDIEPVLQIGGKLKYSYKLGAITVSTETGKVEGIEEVFLLGKASGTPEDRLIEEADLVSKLLAKKELSAAERKTLREIQAMKRLEPLENLVIKERPDFLLTKNYRGMKFICPCQDVTLEDVLKAFDIGYRDIERIKRFTALGTGSCQGRICRFSAAIILSFLRNISLGTLGTFKQRAPVEPIELGFIS